jgi:exonuclease VII small subunit
MKTRRGEDAVRAAERKLEKARKALEEAINHATPP